MFYDLDINLYRASFLPGNFTDKLLWSVIEQAVEQFGINNLHTF